MAAKPLPSQDVLNQLLRYEPETGKLFWRQRSSVDFPNGRYSADRQARAWNTKNSGKEALSAPTGKGYLHGHIDGLKYYAHRVIWKMATGQDPEQVDHINGDNADNRLSNLRSVEHVENQRNMKVSKRNTSGVVGVSWYSDLGKWSAEIGADGKRIVIGYYDKFNDAVDARRSAEVQLGYHKNHGRR